MINSIEHVPIIAHGQDAHAERQDAQDDGLLRRQRDASIICARTCLRHGESAALAGSGDERGSGHAASGAGVQGRLSDLLP